MRTFNLTGILQKVFLTLALLTLVLGVSHGWAASSKPFTFGLLLVGPYNDHGWSQAHFEAGEAIQKEMKNVKMITLTK